MEGKDNNLIELIKNDDMFAAVKDRLDGILDAKNFIGRAPQQVEEFIANEINPAIEESGVKLGQKGEVNV